MNKWLVEITSKEDNFKMTVYEDGTVYGKERGHKLGILNSNAMTEINKFIKEYMPLFKSQQYIKENSIPFTMKVNINSKRQNYFKAVGWKKVIKPIMSIILNRNNYCQMIK